MDLSHLDRPVVQTLGLEDTCTFASRSVSTAVIDVAESASKSSKSRVASLRAFMRARKSEMHQHMSSRSSSKSSSAKSRKQHSGRDFRTTSTGSATYPVIVCTIDYFSEYLLESETFLTGANKFAADRNYRVLTMGSGRIAKDGNFSEKLQELIRTLATTRPPSADGTVKGTVLVIDTKNDQSLQESVFSVCYNNPYVNVVVCGGADDAAAVWFDVDSKMVQLNASELQAKTARPVLIMPFSKSFIPPRQQRDRREGGVGLIRLSPQVSTNAVHIAKYLRLRLNLSGQTLPRVAVMTSLNVKGRSTRDAFLELYQDAGQSDSLFTLQYDSNSAPDKEDKTKRFFALDVDAYVVNGDAELLVFTDFFGLKPSGKLLFVEGLVYNDYILFFLQEFLERSEIANVLFSEYVGELTANNASRAEFIRTLSSNVVANAATMPTLLGYDAMVLADRMVDEYARLGELASPASALQVASQLRGITGSFVFDQFYDRSNGDTVIAARIELEGRSVSTRSRRPALWAELDVATLQTDSRTYNVSNVLDLGVSLRFAFGPGVDIVQNPVSGTVSLLSSSFLRSVYTVRNANGNQVVSEQPIGAGLEQNVLPTSLSVEYDTQEGYVYKNALLRARKTVFAPSDDIILGDGTPAYQFANLLGGETEYNARGVIQLTLVLPDFRVASARIPFEYTSMVESFEADFVAADTRHIMMIVSYDHLLRAYSSAYANRELKNVIVEAVDLLLLQLFERFRLLFRLNLVADGAAAAIVPQLQNIQQMTVDEFARVVFINPPSVWPETEAEAVTLITPLGNKSYLDSAAQRLYDEEVSKLDRMSYGTSYLDFSAVSALEEGDAFALQNSATTNWFRLQDMVRAGAQFDRHSTSRANADLTLYDELLRLAGGSSYSAGPAYTEDLRQDLSWMQAEPDTSQDVREGALDLLLRARSTDVPLAFDFVKAYTLQFERASATVYGVMQIAYFRNMQSSLPSTSAGFVPGKLLASSNVLTPITATALLFPYSNVVTKPLVKTPRSVFKSVGLEISVANDELGKDNVVVDAAPAIAGARSFSRLQSQDATTTTTSSSRITTVVAPADFATDVDAIGQKSVANIAFTALFGTQTTKESASVRLLASLLSSVVKRFNTLQELQKRVPKRERSSTCSLLRYGNAPHRPDLPVAVICLGLSECIYSDVDEQPQGKIAQLLRPYANVLYVNYGDFESSASVAQAVYTRLTLVFQSADIVLFGFSLGTTVAQALAKLLFANESTSRLRLRRCILTSGISNLPKLEYLSNIDKSITNQRKRVQTLIDGMYVTVLYQLLAFKKEERLPILALANQADSIREFIYKFDATSARFSTTLFQRDWKQDVSLLLLTNANDVIVSPDHFAAIENVGSGRGLDVEHIIFQSRSQVDSLLSHIIYRDEQYTNAADDWLRRKVATQTMNSVLRNVNVYNSLDDATQATNATVLKDFTTTTLAVNQIFEDMLVDPNGDGKTFNKLFNTVQKYANAFNAIKTALTAPS